MNNDGFGRYDLEERINNIGFPDVADLPEEDLEPEVDIDKLSVICLADVVAERVTWLWPKRIPVGKLVILDGDPSLGKSTIALTFAAIISTAGRWPDGTGCQYPGDVILLSAEDGLADTIRPRLDAAGANVNRVHAVQGVTMPDGFLRPPTLADIHHLEQLVEETGARLLVIDVFMAYLPNGTDSHKDQDIRKVLSRLSAMADKTGCTVLLLRHLNKTKTAGDPMYRGGGSIGIVGAARAAMIVASDPDDRQQRVLAFTKSNLAPMPGALAYELVSADHLDVARVQWLGPSSHNAHTLLADPVPDKDEANPVDDWLLRFLDGTAQKATEVFSAADANGFSKDQAKRAKARINAEGEVIETYRDTIPGPWFWRMAETQGSEQTPVSQNPAPLLPCAPLQVSDNPKGAPKPQGSKGASAQDTGDAAPLPDPNQIELPTTEGETP